jgi:hypothetical protein
MNISKTHAFDIPQEISNLESIMLEILIALLGTLLVQVLEGALFELAAYFMV